MQNGNVLQIAMVESCCQNERKRPSEWFVLSIWNLFMYELSVLPFFLTWRLYLFAHPARRFLLFHLLFCLEQLIIPFFPIHFVFLLLCLILRYVCHSFWTADQPFHVYMKRKSIQQTPIPNWIRDTEENAHCFAYELLLFADFYSYCRKKSDATIYT